MSKGLGASPGHMSGAEGNSHAAKKCQIYERLAKQILNCNAKDANGLGYYQNKKVWNRGQSLKPASGQKKSRRNRKKFQPGQQCPEKPQTVRERSAAKNRKWIFSVANFLWGGTSWAWPSYAYYLCNATLELVNRTPALNAGHKFI